MPQVPFFLPDTVLICTEVQCPKILDARGHFASAPGCKNSGQDSDDPLDQPMTAR